MKTQRKSLGTASSRFTLVCHLGRDCRRKTVTYGPKAFFNQGSSPVSWYHTHPISNKVSEQSTNDSLGARLSVLKKFTRWGYSDLLSERKGNIVVHLLFQNLVLIELISSSIVGTQVAWRSSHQFLLRWIFREASTSCGAFGC